MSATLQRTRLATVAKIIDQDTIVINQGTEDGIKIGSKFLIFGIGEEVIDPETGDSLGGLEIVKGVGAVFHVQDKLSTLRSSRERSATPTIRTIKKQPGRLGFALGYGESTEEIIEERHGESVTLPFDSVKIGDKARPV